MKGKRTLLPAWFVGEFLGTFILVFFGCGSGAVAILTGAPGGILQVAVVWGIAVAAAIHLTASLSGAHLNPAVTLAFAVWSDFSWRMVPRYIVTQVLGAMAASLALYLVWRGPLESYEAAHRLVRGAPGSEATAMIFGEYFPNPHGAPLTDVLRSTVSPLTAFFSEILGTAILLLVIFGLVDPGNAARPKTLAPAMIGLTVTLLICIFGPLTMAAFNPARDLGPRLFSYFAGWGSVVFRTNGMGWLTVYVIAPIVGGLAGGGAYRCWLAPHFDAGKASAMEDE